MRSRVPLLLLTLVTALTALVTTAASPASAARAEPRGDIQVVGLRHAAHPDYDRVVIDLAGRQPRVAVLRTRTFAYDFSGDPVPIRGPAGLVIALSPAHVFDDDGNGAHDGPRIARPRFDTLRAIALTGDWEGSVTFTLALEHRADYRVLRLHDPERVVVDVAHRVPAPG